jgi:uncharacterized protein Yka (UPF0111/DUF47 family)
MSKRSIFGRSKAIERKIDEFLDKVSESALVVVATLHHSLDSGSAELDETERRRIEAGLIEALHRLVEEMHHVMRFSYHSRLQTPEAIRSDGKELATAVGHAVEQLVQAARAFFRDYTHVRDYVHKVAFYESESDAVRDRLLDKIYATDLGLAEKDHIARSVREIDGVADRAERVADMLTIYAIKRSE